MENNQDESKGKRKVIDAQEIINKLNDGEDVVYEDIEIMGTLDISVCGKLFENENNNIIRIKIKSKIRFINCVFSDDVYFSKVNHEIFYYSDFCENIEIEKTRFNKDIHFVKSQFSEKANFEDTLILGGSNFNDAQFSKKVNFSGVNFSGLTYFVGVQFADTSDFYGTLFSNITNFGGSQFIVETNFYKAIFYGEAYFTGILFSGVANFDEAQFLNKSNFSNTQFLSEANFIGVQFSMRAYFNKTQFLAISKFNSLKGNGEIIFEDVDQRKITGWPISRNKKMNNKYFQEINNHIKDKIWSFRSILSTAFTGKIIFQDSYIGNCSFLYSDMSCFEFLNEKWLKSNGKHIIFEEIGNFNDNALNNEYSINHIEILYRQLKCKFQDKKNFRLADDFLHGEFRMKLRQKKSIFKIICWERLYQLASDFGMNWWRPLLWIVGIVLVSTIFTSLLTNINDLYIKNEILDKIIPTENKFWFNMKYYLFNAFYVPQKTIEINPAVPAGFWILIVSRIENLIIATLLVLSAFAIRRKFRS